MFAGDGVQAPSDTFWNVAAAAGRRSLRSAYPPVPMRLATACLAFVFAAAPTVAQPSDAVPTIVALLLGGDDDTSRDDTPFCPPKGTTEWALVCGAVACGGAIALLWEDYIYDTCATPPPGQTGARGPGQAAASGVPVRIGDGAGLEVVEVREATHLLYGSGQARRGVGIAPGQGAVTVRVLDAQTGQPLALGPLGSTTATVRSDDDLRALLADR